MMRATDLLKHINVRQQKAQPGRFFQHARFLPIFMAPESQPAFHASPMYREGYTNTAEGHAAWEEQAQIMAFIQDELPPPGGVTAESKPADNTEDEGLPDGPVTFNRA